MLKQCELKAVDTRGVDTHRCRRLVREDAAPTRVGHLVSTACTHDRTAVRCAAHRVFTQDFRLLLEDCEQQ